MKKSRLLQLLFIILVSCFIFVACSKGEPNSEGSIASPIEDGKYCLFNDSGQQDEFLEITGTKFSLSTGQSGTYTALVGGYTFKFSGGSYDAKTKDGNIILNGKEYRSAFYSFALNEDNQSYSVSKANDAKYANIEIPKTYFNLPVTTIKADAFANLSVSKVTISDNITTIEKGAFNGVSMEEISIPYIGDGESNTHFGYIFGADTYTDQNVKLPIILKTVEVIGATTIPANSFNSCRKIEKIVLGESVTTIGEKAFYFCSSLKSIIIPNKVNSIGSNILTNCDAIESLTIPSLNSGGVIENLGYLFGIIDTTIQNNYISSSLTSLRVLGGTDIASNALYGCENLEMVVLPSSITEIGISSVQKCNKLNRIYFEGSQSQFNAIVVNEFNSYFNLSNIIYFSKDKPQASGNYYRYVNGVPTIWE